MRVLSWISRLAVITLAAALLFAASIAGVAPRIWGVAQSWRGEPVELPEFTELAMESRAVDSTGATIALFRRQNSQPIELAALPENVTAAFLAVEDRDFLHHNGVNARSLFRASVSNVASGAAQQGASTITMQVAKNEFLGGFERDFRYKLLQIHYALMLERRFSKDEILERYLNTVFFGNNAYGIEAAAETYFGKHAADLSVVESGFLAGLVQSPSSYDPIRNPARSRARFAQVIDQLVEVEMVTPNQAAQLTDRDHENAFQIPARVQYFPDEVPPPRTYFSAALTDYLLNRSDILGNTYDERFSRLYRGGLTIETTLDPTLQTYAESARGVLPDTEQGFDAALLSLDTNTGAVVAMVGGRSFAESEVNMALAPRQTGSSIKYFILAAALQAGVQSNDMIDGVVPCTLPNPGNPDEPFEITNAVSRQTDTLAAMTMYSINCAYARLSQVVGLNRVVDMSYRMAHSPWFYKGQDPAEREPMQPYASLATGANEMAPVDMAAGMQTIANEGLHKQPYLVQRITDASGEVVYEHEDPGTQVLDRGVALEATDVLKGVLNGGTGRRGALANGVPAIGKTGTQEDNTNAWFVGATRSLSTAVWVGDPATYTPMVNVPGFEFPRIQGGTYPVLIWKAFMDAAMQTRPVSDWDAPPPPSREAARLYLPGNECLYQITGYTGGDPIYGQPTPQPTAPAGPGGEGFAGPAAPPDPTTPTPPDDTPPPGPVVVGTTPQQPVYARVEGGTTIPANVTDPNAPVPSILLSQGLIVRPC